MWLKNVHKIEEVIKSKEGKFRRRFEIRYSPKKRFKAKGVNFVKFFYFTSFVLALRQSYFFISALKRKDENLMPQNSSCSSGVVYLK